jgi:glycogen(starch) synthase
MKHLILCREYPPAPYPPGGIGTYVMHIAQLLAERGEMVHVITQLWRGAAKPIEMKCQGRLIIHRVPLGGQEPFFRRQPLGQILSKEATSLFNSAFPEQCFSWQASLLAEKLVEEEEIDLIEAQEFEAPLYYFQLRRALGLGPKRKPPCLVHLHSPTEFIGQHNDWDLSLPSILTAKRLEDYSIAAADALLCPSQYFAHQAEIHYGLTANSIRVIPLPIGDSPLLERDETTWRQGTICYVGRLERRKGVLEWIDAAVQVAVDYPTVQFEFIGADCLGNHQISGIELIERQIPPSLRGQFHFRGKQNRSVLPQFLKRARLAVVPSRWENFPNTCVEAMCSGLPVIASPEGGMAEMLVDGYTGWIADRAAPESLAIVLKRALDTPPDELTKMGERAASAIRQMCSNEKTVDSHLEFRQQLVNQGAGRSLHLPLALLKTQPSLPGKLAPSKLTANQSAQSGIHCDRAQGIAIVVTCFDNDKSLNSCLQSLKRQTQKPVVVVVVTRDSTEKKLSKAIERARREGWPILHHQRGLVSAKNAGIEAISKMGINPLGIAFLSADDRVQSNFIATGAAVLQQCPEVGLVSGWVQLPQTHLPVWTRPCPSFPYQWVVNEAASCSLIRTEALRAVDGFRAVMSQGYEDWDLFNAVMASGWVAVTVPCILATSKSVADFTAQLSQVHAHGKMRREILERFPDLVACDAKSIALLAESNTAKLTQQELFTWQGRIFLLRMVLYTTTAEIFRILGVLQQRFAQGLENKKWAIWNFLWRTKKQLFYNVERMRKRML